MAILGVVNAAVFHQSNHFGELGVRRLDFVDRQAVDSGRGENAVILEVSRHQRGLGGRGGLGSRQAAPAAARGKSRGRRGERNAPDIQSHISTVSGIACCSAEWP